MTDRYSRAEVDEMASAQYEAERQHVDHVPWEALPDYRRWPFRQGVRAVLTVKERIDDRQREAHKAAMRRSVRAGGVQRQRSVRVAG